MARGIGRPMAVLVLSDEADDILAAVKRFCLRVDQNLCHEL